MRVDETVSLLEIISVQKLLKSLNNEWKWQPLSVKTFCDVLKCVLLVKDNIYNIYYKKVVAF